MPGGMGKDELAEKEAVARGVRVAAEVACRTLCARSCTRSVLAMPILSKGGAIIGVTQCLNKRGGGRFSREDEAICTALGSRFSVCVLNAAAADAKGNVYSRGMPTVSDAVEIARA